MEVVDGKQVSAARFEPVRLSQGLALRTVSVAARVVDGASVSTATTRFEVTAEGCSATLAQSADHLMLDATHRMRADITRAMAAQNVAELG
jgi:hypothetical protein